ncbi:MULTISPECIES: hypothetical protein [Sorangium]|uniref:AbiJ-related protein n=1 Tax=Sorangium TaxID=39643 RepID=UPI003D9C3B67
MGFPVPLDQLRLEMATIAQGRNLRAEHDLLQKGTLSAEYRGDYIFLLDSWQLVLHVGSEGYAGHAQHRLKMVERELLAIAREFFNAHPKEFITGISVTPIVPIVPVVNQSKHCNEAPSITITSLTRRDIFDTLMASDFKYWGRLEEVDFLLRLFDLDSLPSNDPRAESAHGDIYMHRIHFPGDMPDDWWLISDPRFDLLQCKDEILLRFLCEMIHPEVRPDRSEVSTLLEIFNRHLKTDGWEIHESNTISGKPVFSARRLIVGLQVDGRPKNVIFASSVKPDLRFKDALNNDIEIVTHLDKVLVFDKPIPTTGLRWRDIQRWWAEKRQLDPTLRTTKENLYLRLLSSLPESSPPQRLLFRTFYATYKDSFEELPALLPEVWLHYDPRTVTERGRDALLRQRMDFLMLFSHGLRVVIEVDGMHHYADSNGRADPAAYAKMAAADRDLRLAGYEVYRFGATELVGPEGEEAVAAFFRELFRLHPP